MTRQSIHLTEEAVTRTALTAFTASTIAVRVLRGYGLELALYATMAPTAHATVTYRDLHLARHVAFKQSLHALATG